MIVFGWCAALNHSAIARKTSAQVVHRSFSPGSQPHGGLHACLWVQEQTRHLMKPARSVLNWGTASVFSATLWAMEKSLLSCSFRLEGIAEGPYT